jgi:acyl-coenzyme A synthetase/AMP-(fatty) acid ligase
MNAPTLNAAAAATAGRVPLLGPRDLSAPFAWVGGRPVSGVRFLADVAAQAALLPARGPVVNLCTCRYRFTVVLAAALVSGRTSLFPPNAMPETLERLRVVHQDLAAASDDASIAPDAPIAGLPRLPLAPMPGEDDDAAFEGAPGVPDIDGAHVAACLLTSGSTGVPQPHEKHWGTLFLNESAAATRLAAMTGRVDLAGLNIVATVPPQHMYGFESSVLLPLIGGATLDAGRPFYPADIAASLARLPRPRALVTTPFHLKTLLHSGTALPPVDLVVSATAPLSPQLAVLAERTLGGALVEIYGCTEAGQVAMRRTAQSEWWETMGALRIHAEPLAGGADGLAERFIVQGGHVSVPTPLADVLELADAHRFRLLGRANDLVHVAGKRTSLSHLNYHLNSLEGVEDGAFWLPRDVADGVVRPVAFVVAPDVPAARILAGLRTRLEPVFLPRRVVHVDALPREATGKLTERALQAFAAARLAEGAA